MNMATLRSRVLAAALFLAGGYLLPTWTVWSVAAGLGDEEAVQRLFLSVFMMIFAAVYLLHGKLYYRLIAEADRRWHKRALLFLWLYLALCGVAMFGFLLF